MSLLLKWNSHIRVMEEPGGGGPRGPDRVRMAVVQSGKHRLAAGVEQLRAGALELHDFGYCADSRDLAVLHGECLGHGKLGVDRDHLGVMHDQVRIGGRERRSEKDETGETRRRE